MSNNRKDSHIILASKAQVDDSTTDLRFNYEPLLGVHPRETDIDEVRCTEFLGKHLCNPIWISSITGGGKNSGEINRRLASLACEFGLGFSTGSLRPVLDGETSLDDFDVRKEIGDDQPFFGNIGVAQLEKYLSSGATDELLEVLSKLECDGLVIHINPLQEFLQLEGDRYTRPAIETIEQFLELALFPVVVKEVGQGMGPKSLKRLLESKVSAIELGAFGGTNFSQLELSRQDETCDGNFDALVSIGHTACEMVEMINDLAKSIPAAKDKKLIISGGIKSALDGYYLTKKSELTAIYGGAYRYMKWAEKGMDFAREQFKKEIYTIMMAERFLEIK